MYSVWIVAGILLSSLAQLGLKRVAVFSPFSIAWLVGIGTSIVLYSFAFVAYSFVLRNYKISVAAPLMTVGVVCVVLLGGILMGETVSPRQWAGVMLALVAVLLLMG